MRSLATLVLALALAGPAAASEARPTSAELESELVCPVCDTTLDTSDSPAARAIEAYIRRRIAAGDTKSEIKAQLVDQFGPAVLAVPPRKGFDWIAWLLPLAGLAVATVTVGAVAWRWRRSRDDGEEYAPLDEELDARVDAELARFE